MRCPGQDRRYWTDDAVFDVPCPQCGAPVELFKDESARRCPQCGHRFQNPGMDFGCAQWCALAEQCLGFVPERQAVPNTSEGALAGRLLQQLGEELKDDRARMAHALKAFHYARELVAREGGDPRVVVAAALLSPLVASSPLDSSAEADGPRKVKQILHTVGVDEATIRTVCEIVGCCQADKDLDSIELKIVRDADTLARLTVECSPSDRDRLDEVIQKQLTTDSAKRKARSWCEAVVGKTEGSSNEQYE